MSHCLSSSVGKNVLAVLENEAAIEALVHTLRQKALQQVYYIYQSSCLSTISNGLVESNQGNWAIDMSALSSLEYFFTKATHPIIILNLPLRDLIQHNDIISVNTQERRVNGFKLLLNTLVITVASKNSAIFQDNSVLSRQHQQYRIATENLPLQRPISEPHSRSNYSLYESRRWKSLLVGYCNYNEHKEKTIVQGYLLQTLDHASPLIITHPPQQDIHFAEFIEEVNAQKGYKNASFCTEEEKQLGKVY